MLIFSWVFEVTPEGIKRESQIDRTQSITPQTGRKLDRAIIGILVVAVALLLVDRFVEKPGPDKTGSENHFPVAASQKVAAGLENGSLTLDRRAALRQHERRSAE